MKRLHLHVAVRNLESSIRFYSTLFGSPPTKQKVDYAKWMLDDPRVNFAISARGAKPGLDHLGIQVDSAEELGQLREQMRQGGLTATDEGETTCCYAHSDKSWVEDPTGIARETYHTMGDAVLFHHGEPNAGACCAPHSTALVQISEIEKTPAR
jgi:catechol 2,3-dioxygenase-like lactoylglutathione lyase family enzyme